MKICFVSHTADLGGGERSLIQLVKSLKKHGMDIYVIVPRKGPLIKELRPYALIIESPYYWWTVRRGNNRENIKKDFREHTKNTLNLYNKIKNKEIDLIFTNTSLVCEGALASWLLKIPHIWHIRELGEKDHGFIFKFGFRNTSLLINSFSDKLIFNSKASYQEFQKYVDHKKSEVIYNHISIDPKLITKTTAISFKDKYSFKLINAGTISKRKGQLDAVKSTLKLLRDGENVELMLAGSNTDKILLTKIEKLIKKSRFSDKIQMFGFQENPYPLIKMSNVLLVNSKNEAFGRTIIEGMLLKKPVIATDSGGVPEIIRDHENGLLYKPKDILGLSNKIIELKKNRKLMIKLIKNGYKTATSSFTDAQYSGKILKLTREVLKQEYIQPKLFGVSKFVSKMMEKMI